MAEPVGEGRARGIPRWLYVALAVVVVAGLVAGGLAVALRSTTPAVAAPASILGWTPGVTRDVPLTAPLTVYFSHSVDHTSVQRSWRLSPNVQGSFSWTDTSVAFQPRSFSP